MEYDYVIVGGGVAGLYSCYKLKDKDNKALFESSNRLGGRLLTDNFMKFILEYGAAKFKIPGHTNLLKLLKVLNIEYKKLDDIRIVDVLPNLKKFTKDELAIYNNAIENDTNAMYDLIEYALKKILGNQWDFENNNILDENRNLNMTYLKVCGKFRGKPLWVFGMWDLLCLFLSQEALSFIKNNSTFYHMIEYNLNALTHICYLLNMLAMKEDSELYTIRNGMQELAKRLEGSIKSNTNIHTEHTLVSIDNLGKKVRLTFLNKMGIKIFVYTSRLFLCINKSGIQKIIGIPNLILNHITSVKEIKLFKIFAIIKNPPWRNNTQNIKYINSAYIPCREIHYTYIPETDLGEVLLFGDYPSINYWNYYSCTPTYQIFPESNNNIDLKQQIINILNRIFLNTNNVNIDIIHYGIRDWSLPPFESGIHFWKPNINPYIACKDLNKFNIGDSKISVCGETFTFNQGYIESALTSVEDAFYVDKRARHSHRLKKLIKQKQNSAKHCILIGFCKTIIDSIVVRDNSGSSMSMP
jgi:hypothetical protein